jgi:hypothetical protein
MPFYIRHSQIVDEDERMFYNPLQLNNDKNNTSRWLSTGI